MRHILVSNLLLVLALGGIAKAQTKEISLEQLARQAEVVFLGRVSFLQAGWNADRTRIETRVMIEVDEYWKGASASNVLTLSIPGGEVGGVGEVYSHMPRFGAEELVVVFAERDQRGTYRVVAGDQGKLTVTEHEVSRKPIVTNGIPLEALKTTVLQSAGLSK